MIAIFTVMAVFMILIKIYFYVFRRHRSVCAKATDKQIPYHFIWNIIQVVANFWRRAAVFLYIHTCYKHIICEPLLRTLQMCRWLATIVNMINIWFCKRHWCHTLGVLYGYHGFNTIVFIVYGHKLAHVYLCLVGIIQEFTIILLAWCISPSWMTRSRIPAKYSILVIPIPMDKQRGIETSVMMYLLIGWICNGPKLYRLIALRTEHKRPAVHIIVSWPNAIQW